MKPVGTSLIVVSGLPRSGTSLMMQMLAAGGQAIVSDALRTADPDNPRGYCEDERVKRLKQDRGWLSEVRGKAIKMVSPLLYDLPADESYRIVFMQRDLDEVLTSQEKMLVRRGQPISPRSQIRKAFEVHLAKLHRWFAEQPHMEVQLVNYNELVANPEPDARRVRAFLGDTLDLGAMLAAVDPDLYRNRNAGPAGPK